jgi:hypothetical protein
MKRLKLISQRVLVLPEKEITSAISKLKNKKAPGLDNISNTMIKQSQTVLLPCLSKLFNSCPFLVKPI